MPRRPSGVQPREITIVLAKWCPHCVPLSVGHARLLARRLRIPLRVLDIDRPRQGRAADRLVRAFGDASPDYLIPQVFLRWSDGTTQHLLTGFSERVQRTDRAWKDLFASRWLRDLAQRGRSS